MKGSSLSSNAVPGRPAHRTVRELPPAFLAPNVEFIDLHPQTGSFLGEVWAGMGARPKKLEPKFFYDETGSRLFERICELPEYYPTRCETAILENHAEEIREAVGEDPLLIEYGSGNSRKVQILFDKLLPAGYIAIDISRAALLQACSELALLHPSMPVSAICADYCNPVTLPERMLGSAARPVAFFPGSTIGNFTPQAAVAFLRNMRESVGAHGGLLIGVDLKKDKARLHAAYNDSDGITAAFNLNLLHRINHELDADFDPSSFEHHAFYNEAAGRIEMHLVSRRRQSVTIAGRTFAFEEGETIHTENSYKYTVEGFRKLAARAGFGWNKVWLDDERLFSVHYFAAV
ncbi:MAG: methyltransferase [Paucimonas sp.]|nr:methyltransferase [Paucimonas sp.]